MPEWPVNGVFSWPPRCTIPFEALFPSPFAAISPPPLSITVVNSRRRFEALRYSESSSAVEAWSSTEIEAEEGEEEADGSGF